MTHEYEENIQKLIAQPMKAKELLEDMYDMYPKEMKQMLHFAVNGKHLDEETMDEALRLITRYDGAKAPFWSMDCFRETLKKTNISLVGQAYNEYDVNYLTQYYMADFKSLGQDPVTFICMAIDRLHDIDDPKACEVAYREAMHRIRKHAK